MEELTKEEQHKKIVKELQTALSHGFEPTFYHRTGKRILDLVLGIPLLIIAAPIIGTAWFIIRITSSGPGFFSQQRVGLHGKLFACYKLRSMYIDQDHRIDMEAVKQSESTGLLVKMENDPRVTWIGNIIRKGSIDELPQLWNVVKGEMSLVGPRPLVPHMVAPYPDLNELRCLVKPGITGEWQVKARNDNRSLSGMVRHDFHYINNCSLRNDLRILLHTIPVVSKAEGAH
jgi:exopolysaccharide production protein ExoY